MGMSASLAPYWKVDVPELGQGAANTEYTLQAPIRGVNSRKLSISGVASMQG